MEQVPGIHVLDEEPIRGPAAFVTGGVIVRAVVSLPLEEEIWPCAVTSTHEYR